MSNSEAFRQSSIVSATMGVAHGDYMQYDSVLCNMDAFSKNALFTAHLASYLADNGEIRDPKVVLAARLVRDSEFRDVGIALIQRMSPTEVMNTIGYIKGKKWPIKIRDGKKTKIEYKYMGLDGNIPRSLRSALIRYLKLKDENIEGIIRANQDDALKGIYATLRIKPFENAADLFSDKPKNALLKAIKSLHELEPSEQAELIMSMNIPYIKAVGAVKVMDEATLYALVSNMTPNQLQHNLGALQKQDAFSSESIKKLVQKKLENPNKKASMRQSVAASAVTDKDIQGSLTVARSAQIAKRGKVKGNYLLIVDKSGSQIAGIEQSKKIVPDLSEMVDGKIAVMVFDTRAYRVELPEKLTHVEVERAFRGINGGGGTSITSVFHVLKEAYDKIVIFTDEEVSESELDVQRLISTYAGNYNPDLSVVVVNNANGRIKTVRNGIERANIPVDAIDISSVDSYALGQILSTITMGKRGFIEQILNTPLIKPY